MNPFATLGLVPRFGIDEKTLRDRKVELGRALHPDRYVGRPASERRRALDMALEVNEAARRLEDPIERAEALLALLGCPVSEDNIPQAKGSFLMEIMELREALRAAGRSGDAGAIEALLEQMRKRRQESLSDLSSAFAMVQGHLISEPEVGAFASSLDEAWKERVMGRLSELRYFRRFFDEAEAFLDEIG